MAANSWADRHDRLAKEVSSFVRHTRWSLRWATHVNNAIVALGLICSFGVTFFGLGGAGEVSALLGAFIAMLIGFDRAFAYGERPLSTASWWRKEKIC
jgi:hypothetical protein